MEKKGALVILVRHGETAGNSSGRLQLPTEPLSEKGLEQAARLGEWFKKEVARGDFKVDTLIASDYHRTQQTAAGVMSGLDADVVVQKPEPLFRERNFGDLRGKLYKDVCAEHGELFAPGFDPPGGESWEVFRQRVDLAWSVLADAAKELSPKAEEPEPALVVVTHGLVLRVLADTYLFPGCAPVNFKNTAMAFLRLNWNEESSLEVTVESANITPHLDDTPLDDPIVRQSVAKY